MTRLCYLSHNYRNYTSAGNKAKSDNELTLKALGATNLALPQTNFRNGLMHFLVNLAGIVKYAFTVRRGDVVVVQYPLKKYFSLVCHIAHMHKDTHVVALIHDLGSFRRRKLTPEAELRRLGAADHVIASNIMMLSHLRQSGFPRSMNALGLFDYRSAAKPSATTNYDPANARVVYGGAISKRKNAFIQELEQLSGAFQLHIYGQNIDFQPDELPSVTFHAFQPVDTFISSIDADFGLVWDGDTIESCTGQWGEYLKYNSPHKASFYLRSGLPIIIWRQAAIAPIIEHEGAGLCVDNLMELAVVLRNLSPRTYAEMRRSALRLSERLDSGYYLQKALEEICGKNKSQAFVN